jgi:hypothetical protein
MVNFKFLTTFGEIPENPVLEKYSMLRRTLISRPTRESAACRNNKYARLACLTTFIVQVAGICAKTQIFPVSQMLW